MLVLWLICIALRYIMGIASVVLNLFTLVCVITRSYLRTSASLLIASLAVSDLLHGLLVVIMVPVIYFSWSTGHSYSACLASICIEATAVFTQFTSFSMLAFERRNSLLFQLNRSKKWSRKTVMIVLILMWMMIVLYNVTVTIFTTKTSEEPRCSIVKNYPAFYNYIAISIYITATILILAGYGHIAIIAHKSRNQVNLAQSTTQQLNRKKDMSITKMMGLVVGTFFMLYLPVVINTATLSPTSPPWHQVLYQISILIYDINFWVNPFIYAWRDKAFKKAFIETISACRRRCCCCRPLQGDAGPTNSNALPQVAVIHVSAAVGSRPTAVTTTAHLVPRDPVITVHK